MSGTGLRDGIEVIEPAQEELVIEDPPSSGVGEKIAFSYGLIAQGSKRIAWACHHDAQNGARRLAQAGHFLPSKVTTDYSKNLRGFKDFPN